MTLAEEEEMGGWGLASEVFSFRPYLFCNPSITDTLRQPLGCTLNEASTFFDVYHAVGTERSDIDIESSGEELPTSRRISCQLEIVRRDL